MSVPSACTTRLAARPADEARATVLRHPQSAHRAAPQDAGHHPSATGGSAGDFPASDELVREGKTTRARVAAAGHRAGTRHHARCTRQRRRTHNSRRAEEARTTEEDSATDEVDRDPAPRQAARHRAIDRLDAAEQRISKKPAQSAGFLLSFGGREATLRSSI